MTDRDLLEKILTKIEGIETKVNGIETQQKEDHNILKALEHRAEVNKSEHDKIMNDIIHIEGHLTNIAESVDVMKDVIGRHQIDIEILKRRPV